MDLIGVMLNAAQGLGVYRAQVATASNNISNANTPGYSRQEAVATETTPSEVVGTNGYIGRGVTLQGVVQARDPFVEAQLSMAFSNSSSSSAQSDALSTVTALNPQSQTSVTNALGAFYSALRSLNQNPSDLGLRQSVVDSAQSLATAFNTTSSSIIQARNGIDQNVSAVIDKVNGLLSSVADLNKSIALAVNSGRTPNDLLDVRQNDLDQLAQMIGARAVPDDHSGVNIVLPGGTCLVSGIVASKLSIQANVNNGNHLDVVFQPQDGGSPSVLKQSELGGQIGGLVSARDDTLGTAETSLDNLAFDFSSAINGQHEKGYALDGSTGHDLFTVLGGPTDAAKNIAVDATVFGNPSLVAAAGSTPVASGDSTNLQALIATEDATLPSSNLSASGAFAKLTSDFGIAQSSASDSAAFNQSVMTDLTNARASTSGVSVDDELTKLMQAQNAYNALSKVIATSNTMLQDLMNII